MIEKAFRYRYLIILAVFVVWTLFFDSRNVFVLKKQMKQIEELSSEKDFYQTEIERLTDEKENLFSDINNLETFGREKFRMKRPEEDLYIVEKKKKD